MSDLKTRTDLRVRYNDGKNQIYRVHTNGCIVFLDSYVNWLEDELLKVQANEAIKQHHAKVMP